MGDLRGHGDGLVQIGALDHVLATDLLFVSANGPSAATISPSRTRTVVASGVGRNRAPSRNTPRAIAVPRPDFRAWPGHFGLPQLREPFGQADRHGFTGVFSDLLAQGGLHRQLVGAIPERHERALKGVTVDGSAHFHEATSPEESVATLFKK